jgi:hypothetical protein
LQPPVVKVLAAAKAQSCHILKHWTGNKDSQCKSAGQEGHRKSCNYYATGAQIQLAVIPLEARYNKKWSPIYKLQLACRILAYTKSFSDKYSPRTLNQQLTGAKPE